jgi:hypothetical protein
MAADECMTPAPRISFLLPRIASERCLAPVRACEAGWRRRYARREIAPASCSVAPAATSGCVCATCARRAGAPVVRFDVADHNGGSRRDESAGALSGCAEQRRAPHRVPPGLTHPHRRADAITCLRSDHRGCGCRRRVSRSPRPRSRVTREAIKRACSLTAALGTGDPTRVAEYDAEGAAFPRDVRGRKNEMRGAGAQPCVCQ